MRSLHSPCQHWEVSLCLPPPCADSQSDRHPRERSVGPQLRPSRMPPLHTRMSRMTRASVLSHLLVYRVGIDNLAHCNSSHAVGVTVGPVLESSKIIWAQLSKCVPKSYEVYWRRALVTSANKARWDREASTALWDRWRKVGMDAYHANWIGYSLANMPHHQVYYQSSLAPTANSSLSAQHTEGVIDAFDATCGCAFQDACWCSMQCLVCIALEVQP